MPSCLVDFDRGGPLDSSIADRRLADGERPVSNMNFRRAEIESFEHGAIQSMMDQLALVLARLNATAEQNGWVPGTPPHVVPSYWLKGQVRAKVLLAGQKRKQARHTSIQFYTKAQARHRKVRTCPAVVASPFRSTAAASSASGLVVAVALFWL